MPAKPKITRLSDPANPYNQKKLPTGRPQDRPKPSVEVEPRRGTTTRGPAKTKAQSFLSGLNNQIGGGARKRAIDARLEAATGSKKKK